MAAPELRGIYYYVARTCNQRCDHCYIMAGPEHSLKNDLPVEQVIGKIEEAMTLGLRIVKFTGGEPLVKPRIGEIIDFCGGAGLQIGVETNATLVDDVVAARLGRWRAYVAVSIDSADPQAHDEMRHMRGGFQRAVEGLQLLRRAGCRTQITASIHRGTSTHDALLALVRLAESVSAVKLKLNIITADGRATGMSGLLSTREAIAVNKLVEDAIIPQTELEVCTSLPMAFKAPAVLRSSTGAFSCDVKHIVGLLPDGTWSLCGFAVENPDLILTSDRNAPLKEVWERSWQLRQLRDTDLRKLSGVCASCVMNTLCRGVCPASTFARRGTFQAPFPFCQEAYEQDLFPSSRLSGAPPTPVAGASDRRPQPLYKVRVGPAT
jgi:SynChlorMet cassette radical SAM/SPASM protein ScmF